MRRPAIAAAALAGLVASQPVPAEDWTVDYGASTLGFTAAYDEIPFDGRFGTFDARIRFDPEHPEAGQFTVTVDIGSVDTDSADRDEGMQDPDWFDTARYPEARFESTRLEALGEGGDYTAIGDLTIKGITNAVTLSFHWTRSDASVRLRGSGSVKRGDFDIGAGDWADDDTVGFDVGIEFDLTLSR